MSDAVVLILAVPPGLGPADGRNVLIDLASKAAGTSGSYANLALTQVDDHVVRMSVMTKPFYWHRHPNSDEMFLVLEGVLLLELADARIELRPGQLYTVPAGVPHSTSPISERSVNITVERIQMATERLDRPDPDAAI